MLRSRLRTLLDLLRRRRDGLVVAGLIVVLAVAGGDGPVVDGAAPALRHLAVVGFVERAERILDAGVGVAAWTYGAHEAVAVILGPPLARLAEIGPADVDLFE